MERSTLTPCNPFILEVRLQIFVAELSKAGNRSSCHQHVWKYVI